MVSIVASYRIVGMTLLLQRDITLSPSVKMLSSVEIDLVGSLDSVD